MMRKVYIVWNETRTEGYVTLDKGVAYEARKGASSNCYTADGDPAPIAVAFIDAVGPDENCTIQEIEIAT